MPVYRRHRRQGAIPTADSNGKKCDRARGLLIVGSEILLQHIRLVQQISHLVIDAQILDKRERESAIQVVKSPQESIVSLRFGFTAKEVARTLLYNISRDS